MELQVFGCPDYVPLGSIDWFEPLSEPLFDVARFETNYLEAGKFIAEPSDLDLSAEEMGWWRPLELPVMVKAVVPVNMMSGARMFPLPVLFGWVEETDTTGTFFEESILSNTWTEEPVTADNWIEEVKVI